MSANRDREEEIFDAARELAANERAAYLVDMCGQDADLRKRIEGMLEADAAAGEFFKTHDAQSPTVILADANLSPSIEKAGDRIGRYKLLQQIGEGGMGLVYMAEQDQPVRRSVALKIIKLGMDTRQVVARFEAERQALEMMNHPHIAKVFDAGATDSGRPYFVMELVRGIPITEYCDKNFLSTRQRLDLFILVCQAVQHAHQKGVIHRDLKPSNILVTLNDGVPWPMVIDFGIAKATHQRLTEKTLFTNFAQVIGTPAYMSPEQAEMSKLDVDTRTDIYALGVLLYELLTGTPPFPTRELLSLGYREMQRTIAEREPLRLSTRLSTMANDERTVVAKNRSVDVTALAKLFRGDLDWIAMKALEKDRSRRYASASDFAMDVQRHLDDEPVIACPPSTVYRVKKFVRRNKGFVSAAAIVLLVLCAGIIGTGWGLVRAERARQREAQRADGERQAKETALAREAETMAVLGFVENKVFAAARPEGKLGGLGRNVTLRNALEAALADPSFPTQPLIEARLRMTLGISFGTLGEAGIAAGQFERARTLYHEHLGAAHPDTLASMSALAVAYSGLGRHAEAIKLGEETLALMKATLGPDNPKTLSTMGNLAKSYDTFGQHSKGIQLLEETLALKKARLGPDDPSTLGSMNNLALARSAVGQHLEALQLGEETLAINKARQGPRHPDTLSNMDTLASIYQAGGRHGEAVKLYEETLPLMKAILGPDHPHTLVAMHSLARSYVATGREAEAIKLREELLVISKTKLGPIHPETLKNMKRLAWLLVASKDLKLRDPQRAVALAKEVAESKPDDGELWNTLGVAHYRASNWQFAVDALVKSMEIRNGGDSFGWLYLAMAHWQLGEKDKARQRYDQGVNWMTENKPANEDLTRLRNEAAELLGVSKEK